MTSFKGGRSSSLEKNALTIDDVDLYVLPQADIRVTDAITDSLKAQAEKL